MRKMMRMKKAQAAAQSSDVIVDSGSNKENEGETNSGGVALIAAQKAPTVAETVTHEIAPWQKPFHLSQKSHSHFTYAHTTVCKHLPHSVQQ